MTHQQIVEKYGKKYPGWKYLFQKKHQARLKEIFDLIASHTVVPCATTTIKTTLGISGFLARSLTLYLWYRGFTSRPYRGHQFATQAGIEYFSKPVDDRLDEISEQSKSIPKTLEVRSEKQKAEYMGMQKSKMHQVRNLYLLHFCLTELPPLFKTSELVAALKGNRNFPDCQQISQILGYLHMKKYLIRINSHYQVSDLGKGWFITESQKQKYLLAKIEKQTVNTSTTAADPRLVELRDQIPASLFEVVNGFLLFTTAERYRQILINSGISMHQYKLLTELDLPQLTENRQRITFRGFNVLGLVESRTRRSGKRGAWPIEHRLTDRGRSFIYDHQDVTADELIAKILINQPSIKLQNVDNRKCNVDKVIDVEHEETLKEIEKTYGRLEMMRMRNYNKRTYLAEKMVIWEKLLQGITFSKDVYKDSGFSQTVIYYLFRYYAARGFVIRANKRGKLVSWKITEAGKKYFEEFFNQGEQNV